MTDRHASYLKHSTRPVVKHHIMNVGRTPEGFTRWQNGKRRFLHNRSVSQVLVGSRNRAKLFDILCMGVV